LEASALGSLIAACPAWKRREEKMDMDMDTTEGIHKLGTVLRFSAKQ